MIESVPIKEYNINNLLTFVEANMDYLTTNEMSEIWEISSRRISLLCAQGRIEGAVKKGKTWLIPQNAKKPTDPRKTRKVNS